MRCVYCNEADPQLHLIFGDDPKPGRDGYAGSSFCNSGCLYAWMGDGPADRLEAQQVKYTAARRA